MKDEGGRMNRAYRLDETRGSVLLFFVVHPSSFIIHPFPGKLTISDLPFSIGEAARFANDAHLERGA
jgi:hypothetical protein